jgi:hypothetical protein
MTILLNTDCQFSLRALASKNGDEYRHSPCPSGQEVRKRVEWKGVDIEKRLTLCRIDPVFRV